MVKREIAQAEPEPTLVRARDSRRPRSSRPPSADYNLRILWPLARWLEANRGEGALERVTDGTEASPRMFDLTSRWVSAETFETILARARAMVPDEETFMRAAAYRIKDAYGPLRYVLWAASPGAVYGQAAKTYRMVSTVGKPSVVVQDRTHCHVRIEPEGPAISRLACLSRQAQMNALPTLWGLPAAHVREDACIAWGDPTCELHFHWYATRRWLPTALGAAVAALIALAFLRLGVASPPAPLIGAVLGGLIGYLVEGRRADRINERTRVEVMEAVQLLARGEAEARGELQRMHDRQKNWTRLVEEEMASRAAAIQKLSAGVEELQQARATTVLGFSHDLRNPLQIIQMSADYLLEAPVVQGQQEVMESVRDIRTSVDRMRRMLGDLVVVTRSHREFVTMAPARVDTAELLLALRRRLSALAYGTDVRTSASATREAPDHVEVDPLALDRIVDNLLTNAAKYTEHGSIALELTGSPGHLVIKIADTGRGIAPEVVEHIFDAGGSSVASRRGDSFGVGLSVVVQLLDQIGGRLEVLSRPASGTTFWVHLPVVAPARASEAERLSEPTGGALKRVVRIRRVPG